MEGNHAPQVRRKIQGLAIPEASPGVPTEDSEESEGEEEQSDDEQTEEQEPEQEESNAEDSEQEN